MAKLQFFLGRWASAALPSGYGFRRILFFLRPLCYLYLLVMSSHTCYGRCFTPARNETRLLSSSQQRHLRQDSSHLLLLRFPATSISSATMAFSHTKSDFQNTTRTRFFSHQSRTKMLPERGFVSVMGNGKGAGSNPRGHACGNKSQGRDGYCGAGRVEGGNWLTLVIETFNTLIKTVGFVIADKCKHTPHTGLILGMVPVLMKKLSEEDAYMKNQVALAFKHIAAIEAGCVELSSLGAIKGCRHSALWVHDTCTGFLGAFSSYSIRVRSQEEDYKIGRSKA
eukprot:Gb_37271 [translate_table: standard]